MTKQHVTKLQLLNADFQLQQCIHAVELEIQAQKKELQGSITIINGTPLYKLDDCYIYYFQYNGEKRLLEQIPVTIEIGEHTYDGELISVQEQSVEVKIADVKKKHIAEARLHTESWRILENLCTRLENTKNEEKQVYEVARRFIDTPPPVHLTKSFPPKKELAYRSFFNDITYIWGPPGTGKTYQLSRLAVMHSEKNQNVLVLGHSHASVDVLFKEIVHVLKQKKTWRSGYAVRYGYTQDAILREEKDATLEKVALAENEHLQHEIQQWQERATWWFQQRLASSNVTNLDAFRRQLDEDKTKWMDTLREEKSRCMKEARIVGATITAYFMNEELFQKEFHTIIVDEVSMVLYPYFLCLASKCKRLILCGDFKQLPPVTISQHNEVKQWLRNDVFVHSGIVEHVKKGTEHPHLFMLKKQRRMHADIAAFTNNTIYQKRVRNDSSIVNREQYTALTPWKERAMILCDTSDVFSPTNRHQESGSHWNILSAFIAVELAVTALKSGMPSVGIVTPYRAQVELLTTIWHSYTTKKRHLIKIATVHRFQGDECDFIIFDSVDRKPEYGVGQLLRNEDEQRLMNVAITRAKSKFCLIADSNFLEEKATSSLTICKLQRFLQQNGVVEWSKDTLEQFGDNRVRLLHSNDVQLLKEWKNASSLLYVCPFSSPYNMNSFLEPYSNVRKKTSSSQQSFLIANKKNLYVPLFTKDDVYFLSFTSLATVKLLLKI